MTVYRRDSKDDPRWVVDFRVGGNRVDHTLAAAWNKRETQTAEARLKAEYRARLNRSGTVTRMTVEGAVQRYVAERLKPRTRNPDGLATYLCHLGPVREHFGPAAPVESTNNAAFAREAGTGAGNEVPTFLPDIPDDGRTR